MNKIKQVYEILYHEYGPQHWWPCSTKNNFEIIIGAILTQNTSWNNVEKAINNLKKENMISADKISKADKNKLAELIKPSGYYNQKTERLKATAKFFKENKNITRDSLLSIKGIGPETADSIILYAFNKPYFVIDAYTKRIFKRLGIKETEDYSTLQTMFTDALEKNHILFNEYHALIVRLAKEKCKKNPDCEECPLNKICKHNI